jgi:5-methyltetrahydropteroyltriglutamate--homocysteine methyltransferase
MPHYRKYTTTVVGAHSVPRWYETLDRLVTVGQLAPGDFADAQFRASQAAILEQEIAGIDIITGGEMHRRTHNRHSPPNATLNHFWQKIPAFQGTTRPKPISKHDPNVFHPAATCRGPIAEAIDLGLVEEFLNISSFARKPVKITVTGPHLLAAVAYDEYYNDTRRMMMDIGKLLHWNLKRLAEAGCKHIQVDEAYFTAAPDDEVAAAIEAINLAIEGLPDDVTVLAHVCQGNYAVGPDYDGTRVCCATSSSASAPSMCSRPMSKAANWSRSALRSIAGWRPNRLSSPVPAASTICPGISRWASCAR